MTPLSDRTGPEPHRGKPAASAPVFGDPALDGAELKAAVRQLARECSVYREPLISRAVVQLVSTLLPFLLLCGLMLWCAAQGYWLALLLAVPAAGLLVRLFIFQHDCGHGSFFASRTANDWLGRALSLLTMTPYDSWKRTHALHHASSGDLSRRGIGDIETLTVKEYLALSWLGRFRYRFYRNPLFLILLGSPANFLVLQRIPFALGVPWRTTWRSVSALNLAMVAAYGTVMAAVGVLPVVAVYLPIILMGAWIGGWLFYVQHQFESTTWDDAADWDVQVAAITGSSYYVLPRVLQWFTGNIGLHHIHHLNSRIPNYRLQECIDDNAVLGRVNRLTLRESFACLWLALWDEERRKLIGFSQIGKPQPA